MRRHYSVLERIRFEVCLGVGVLCFFLPIAGHHWPGLVFAGDGEAPSNKSVHYAKGRLSVSLKSARLGEVLQQVSRETGLTIHSAVPLEEVVSVEFTEQPLESGLARLLGKWNYYFAYREAKGNKLTPGWLHVNVWGPIDPRGFSGAMPASVNAAASSPNPSPPAREAEELRRHIEVLVGEKVQTQMEALEVVSKFAEVQLPELSEELLKKPSK